jgi:hypothetical protein
MRKRLAAAVVVSLLSGLITSGVADAAALQPVLTAKTIGGMSAEFTVDPGPGAAEIESITYDLGIGYTMPVLGNRSITHNYLHPGTYEISAVVVDVAGNRGTARSTFATAGSGYTAFGPTRILDTRSGLGAPLRKLAPRGSLHLDVAGLPATTTAVAVNVTVANATAAGWLAAYPYGQARPNSSVVDYPAGMPVSNATVVAVNGSSLTLYNGGGAAVDVIVDITGYFEKSGENNGFDPMFVPVRLIDTRAGSRPLSAGSTMELNVETDRTPYGATAVALNVTAVAPSASGFVTVYPAGNARPNSSNLNFTAGRIVANQVIVPITRVDDDHAMIRFYSNATTHLLIDVTGYFGGTTFSHFVPVTPARVVDTRSDIGLAGPLAARSTNWARTGTAAPANLGTPDGIIASAKVVNATRAGFLGAEATFSYDPPLTSLLNFYPGTVTGNFMLGRYDIGTYFHNGSSGTIDVVADAFGYFYID